MLGATMAMTWPLPPPRRLAEGHCAPIGLSATTLAETAAATANCSLVVFTSHFVGQERAASAAKLLNGVTPCSLPSFAMLLRLRADSRTVEAGTCVLRHAPRT